MLSGVHSRAGVATVSSDPDRPDQDHVPTPWFRTTSPVFSAIHPVAGVTARAPLRALALRVAGLLHPAANRGVRRVSGWLLLFPGLTPVARDVLLPLEGFPPSSAVPCHHGLCLPVVLPSRSMNLTGSRCRSCRSIRLPPRASASRPCSVDGSVPPCAVSDDRWPTLPWASGSPPRSFDSDLPLARSIGTNSRSASAVLSLFRRCTFQWARRRVHSPHREARSGARKFRCPPPTPAPAVMVEKATSHLVHPKVSWAGWRLGSSTSHRHVAAPLVCLDDDPVGIPLRVFTRARRRCRLRAALDGAPSCRRERVPVESVRN